MKICTSGWSILKSSKQVQSFILEIESKQFAYKQMNKQQNHPMTITDFALSILARKLNLLLRILHLYSTSQALLHIQFREDKWLIFFGIHRNNQLHFKFWPRQNSHVFCIENDNYFQNYSKKKKLILVVTLVSIFLSVHVFWWYN